MAVIVIVDRYMYLAGKVAVVYSSHNISANCMVWRMSAVVVMAACCVTSLKTFRVDYMYMAEKRPLLYSNGTDSAICL